MSLAEALERAAQAAPTDAEPIRAARGDPARLLAGLAPEAAGRLLAWLLEAEPEAGRELLEAWAELPGGETPLAGLDEDELPRPARKALRRARHRLRSRGISLPRPAPRPHVAALPRVEDAIAEARVSPVDPSGAQLLVLVESQPAGGVRVFEAIVDDERGLLEFHAFASNRSRARRFLRELDTGDRLAAVPTAPGAVRARLARVLAAHPAERALPRGFAEWRAQLADPGDAATPGASARAALEAGAEPELAKRAVELVEQGVVGPWPPSGPRLREFADKVEAAARSRIVVSDQQRRERVETLLAELLADRFGGSAAQAAAARWEETAYVFWKRGQEPEAHAALAAAASFRTTPPARNPVARALLERALQPVLAALREEERSSPLVKP